MATLGLSWWAITDRPAPPRTPVASYGRGLSVSASEVRIRDDDDQGEGACGADDQGNDKIDDASEKISS
jgi:hypothetical protein